MFVFKRLLKLFFLKNRHPHLFTLLLSFSTVLLSKLVDMKKKTLIVDSDPSIRSIFEFMLHQAGFDTASAESGQACLRVIDTQTDIDLIFLDINLPDISGKTILKEIHNKKPNLMVILMANDGFMDILNSGYQLGAYGIIYKPFDIEEVLSVIKKVLQAE